MARWPSASSQFERRYLTLAPLLDGMTSIDGMLDGESAALLTAALEPFLVPTGPEDLRTAAQRRADGLIDIVRAACDHRLLPLVGGERPHLQVHSSLEHPRRHCDTAWATATGPGRQGSPAPEKRGPHRL